MALPALVLLPRVLPPRQGEVQRVKTLISGPLVPTVLLWAGMLGPHPFNICPGYLQGPWTDWPCNPIGAHHQPVPSLLKICRKSSRHLPFTVARVLSLSVSLACMVWKQLGQQPTLQAAWKPGMAPQPAETTVHWEDGYLEASGGKGVCGILIALASQPDVLCPHADLLWDRAP
ncbi:hypothetical protein H8959_012374 [Pygathrix nigripes]